MTATLFVILTIIVLFYFSISLGLLKYKKLMLFTLEIKVPLMRYVASVVRNILSPLMNNI